MAMVSVDFSEQIKRAYEAGSGDMMMHMLNLGEKPDAKAYLERQRRMHGTRVRG